MFFLFFSVSVGPRSDASIFEWKYFGDGTGVSVAKYLGHGKGNGAIDVVTICSRTSVQYMGECSASTDIDILKSE